MCDKMRKDMIRNEDIQLMVGALPIEDKMK